MKIGPKELALKKMREDDLEIPTFLRRTETPDQAEARRHRYAKRTTAAHAVTLAPPPAIQKAIRKEFAENKPISEAAATAKAETMEIAMTTKPKNTKSSKAPKPKAAAEANGGPRPGTKLQLVADLLKRKGGCTAADILKATGWPAVSVPAQAKAAGLTLSKKKDGKITHYSAT